MENFKLVARDLRILIGFSAKDKYLMAIGFKKLGRIVAMTGDGASDPPALKKASIGLALDSGTESKQASGIVLLDDSLDSILTAIIYGRKIFDDIS